MDRAPLLCVQLRSGFETGCSQLTEMAPQEHSKGERVVTLAIDPISHPHTALSQQFHDESRGGPAKGANYDRTPPLRSRPPKHSSLAVPPGIGSGQMSRHAISAIGQIFRETF